MNFLSISTRVLISLMALLVFSACSVSPTDETGDVDNVQSPQVESNTQQDISNESSNTQVDNNSTNEEDNQPALIPAVVTSVVDGDTVKVNIEGSEETIRLLLIDTPEVTL